MRIKSEQQQKIRAMLSGNTEIMLDGFMYRIVAYDGTPMIEQCQIVKINGRSLYRLIDFFIASR